MYQFWHNTQRNAQLRKSWNFWVLPNYFPPIPRFSDVIWISKRIDDEKVVLTTFSLFCGESFDRKEEFSSVQRRRPPCLFPRSQVLVRGKSVACFGTGEGKGPCSSSETFNHPWYIYIGKYCLYVRRLFQVKLILLENVNYHLSDPPTFWHQKPVQDPHWHLRIAGGRHLVLPSLEMEHITPGTNNCAEKYSHLVALLLKHEVLQR